MLDRIAEAERRASSAEERAREAVDRVAEPLPEMDTSEIFEVPTPPLTRSPRRRSARTATRCSKRRCRRQPGADPRVVLELTRARARPRRTTPEPDAGRRPRPVRINAASYEQLRELGLSVTQTGRVLAFRERVGGFNSLDDLDQIPGFPSDFLDRAEDEARALSGGSEPVGLEQLEPDLAAGREAGTACQASRSAPRRRSRSSPRGRTRRPRGR